MTDSALERAIEIAGGQTALAKKCGVTQQAVSKWLRDGTVGAKYVLEIERATGGRVTCFELRPDIYPPERFREAV